MLSPFGIVEPAFQYAIAIAILLILLVLLGVVVRRIFGGRLLLSGQDRGRARQPRLGVVDIYDLDRQRQLILLRRDNVEHLLLIGGPNDVVIETNIVRVAGARLPTADAPVERTEPTFERPAEPVRPQIEPNGRPSIETQIAARLGALTGRPGQGRSETEQASAPARSEPALKPSAVTLATPAPSPAPASPRNPLGSRSETVPPARPAPAAPQPRPASEPPPARPAPRSDMPRPEPRPVPPAPKSPTPPPPPSAPERHADAAALSDMAKQLEEALRRPSSSPAPNRALPALDDPREEQDNLTVPPARPMPPPRPDPARSEPAALEPEPAPTEPSRAEPPPYPMPPRASPAPHRPLPPPPATPPAPPPDARPSDDPFSVDEIEAEFARLLGRPQGGNGKS